MNLQGQSVAGGLLVASGSKELWPPGLTEGLARRDGEEAIGDGGMIGCFGEVLKKGCDLRCDLRAWKVLRKKVVIMQSASKGGPLFGGCLWPRSTLDLSQKAEKRRPCSIPYLHQTLPTHDPTSGKL